MGSNVTFAAVAVSAKHLAIFCCCFAAFAPWGNMIGLHFFNCKMLSAFYTNAFLPFIRRPCHFRGEGTNIQVSLLSVKQIFINTFLVGNITIAIIFYQLNNLSFKNFRVIFSSAVLVVEDAPFKPFH